MRPARPPGFGGGGVHGYRALEGTFLGGCIFSGRAAGAGDGRVGAAMIPATPPAGLCNRCRHQQLVRTTRGSVFSLCRRWKTEPERFPAIPGSRSSVPRGSSCAAG